MVYSIILLLAFILAILIRNFRNRYTLRIAALSAGLILIILSHLFLICKRGNYPVTHGLLALDYQLYLILTRIVMPYRQIFVLNNIGIATCSLMIPLISQTYLVADPSAQMGRKIRFILLILAYPVAYLLFYDPENCYKLYIQLYTGHFRQLPQLLTGIDALMQAGLLACLFLPVLRLFVFSRKTPSIFVRSRTNVVILCLLLLNSLFIIMYFGPIKRIYALQPNLTDPLLKQAFSMAYFAAYSRVVPLVMFAIIVVMFLMLVRYNAIDTADWSHGLLRRTKTFEKHNRSLRDMLHAYKNTFFTQRILYAKLTEQYGTPEGEETLRRLITINDEKMTEVAKALDSIREMRFKIQICSVVACIRQAINQLQPPAHVRIDFDADGQVLQTYFEERYLTEVFVNLLQNAIDAIEAAGLANGQIRIELQREQELIIVRISDNGIGMSARQKKQIFDLYYSTKPSSQSWGLGLSFVLNVVRSQYGVILVQSAPDRGTTFELVLRSAKASEVNAHA